ncbi:hypothetical protein ABT294_20680 [Nonomuraea sp. NPDC000554]|uniref:hypothetical protein n=1 Tax=Nonomuraea sp. NPDC000554 TaxID=3154259 RepID=UPI0033174851
MSSGFEIDRTWVGQEAPRRMRTHGEEYEAAVQRLTEHGLGATWGDTELIADLRAAIDECFPVMEGVLGSLGSGLVQTGDGMSAGDRNIGHAETAGLAEIEGLGGEAWK